MTRQLLPPCSIPACDHAAAAVMDGVLLCGMHAASRLKSRELSNGKNFLRRAAS